MRVLYIFSLLVVSEQIHGQEILEYERRSEAMLTFHHIYDFAERLFLIELADQFSVSDPILFSGIASLIDLRGSHWMSGCVLRA